MEFTVSTSITPQDKQQMNKNDYERVQAERKRLDERGFIEYTDSPNFGALNMPKNKTPKKGFKSSNDVTKEIEKIWKEHNKKEKENGMVRE